MEKNERDKLLERMAKERNSYVQHIDIEEARLRGKVEGADYILQRLSDYFHEDIRSKMDE